ncbi:hypothetical protein D0962_23010 [Leptolyngbyaceae cyanobacterium CCMR0082]|uniref:Uncharacterized protein n=1 Tax=Adonisia turfae CCMR0082 TaxID=2304604 RepID=A0A6M0SAV1_9CYAN|nr:hypothetical protein [Adonisia turfae CCMR0082]
MGISKPIKSSRSGDFSYQGDSLIDRDLGREKIIRIFLDHFNYIRVIWTGTYTYTKKEGDMRGPRPTPKDPKGTKLTTIKLAPLAQNKIATYANSKGLSIPDAILELVAHLPVTPHPLAVKKSELHQGVIADVELEAA